MLKCIQQLFLVHILERLPVNIRVILLVFMVYHILVILLARLLIRLQEPSTSNSPELSLVDMQPHIPVRSTSSSLDNSLALILADTRELLPVLTRADIQERSQAYIRRPMLVTLRVCTLERLISNLLVRSVAFI